VLSSRLMKPFFRIGKKKIYIVRMKNIKNNTATIEQFNIFVMQQDVDRLPIGLFEGKMGLAIYFYHQARLWSEKRYKTFAKKLLNSMYEQINSKLPVDFKFGLTGICSGMLHLFETGFIKGNPNFVLKELDDKIINTLYFSYFSDNQNISSYDLIIIAHCSLYLCKRLTDNKLAKNEKHIFEQIIIRAVNKIETSISSEKITEPWLFSRFDYFPVLYLELIEKVYKLGFYRYKLDKVCDEWNERLTSALPTLKSHRLLMAVAMEKVNRFYKSGKWTKHISLLKQSVDIESVINTDFRDKNLYIADGLSRFYIFLKENNLLTGSAQELISEKIAYSEIWNDFKVAPDNKKQSYIGLMDGLTGVILTTQSK